MKVPYDELVEFIARGPTAREVAEFQASPASKDFVFDLLYREKTTGLTPEEAKMLDHCLAYEHLMRLAKAQARLRLVQ